MIRVLVAADSRTARLLLVEVLSSDPEIEVVGQASNGVEAVELTRALRPDLVTMDLHMPGMDGLEATKEIMVSNPTPIVIVTASAAASEVEGSLHALRAGALDVVQKPAGPRSPDFYEAVGRLIRTVKALSQVKVVRHWRAAPAGRVVPGRGQAAQKPVVAVVASTGGPAALEHLLRGLPGDFAAPLLVVQHITPGFTAGLAAWLKSVSDLHVKVAEQGEPLLPHTVYLAPDGRHLGVTPPARILLSDAAPVGGFRPSGTFLFESVAALGRSALAVILTGMGEDGVAGLRAVRGAGGRVIAQDQQSSVVFGMPGAAVAAGLAEQVLSLDAIAARLVQLLGSAKG
jgi:two-component system chemotaxis response regulator CheB